MNQPGSLSTASSNKTEQQLQLALPLAAIISLSITCYVIAVIVGKKSINYKYFMIHYLYIYIRVYLGIAVRNWLIKMCCCSVPTSDEKNCDCDIFPSCSFGSVQSLCGCCKQSSSNTTCCNAVKFRKNTNFDTAHKFESFQLIFCPIVCREFQNWNVDCVRSWLNVVWAARRDLSIANHATAVVLKSRFTLNEVARLTVATRQLEHVSTLYELACTETITPYLYIYMRVFLVPPFI